MGAILREGSGQLALLKDSDKELLNSQLRDDAHGHVPVVEFLHRRANRHRYPETVFLRPMRASGARDENGDADRPFYGGNSNR